jgi:hypothetical protein
MSRGSLGSSRCRFVTGTTAEFVERRDLDRMISFRASRFSVLACRLGVVGSVPWRRCGHRGGLAPVLPVVQALAAASSRPGVGSGQGRVFPVVDDPNTRRPRLNSDT